MGSDLIKIEYVRHPDDIHNVKIMYRVCIGRADCHVEYWEPSRNAWVYILNGTLGQCASYLDSVEAVRVWSDDNES